MKHEQNLKGLLERAMPELEEHCWHMKIYGPIAETNKNLPRNEQLVREIKKALKEQPKQGTLAGLDLTCHAPTDEQIWAKFVLYYESFGRGMPEREDLDNPLMDVQEHYNLFKAEYHAKRETLRDEFAGQAMQGLLIRSQAGSIDKPDIAYQSYRMAQEMMRMRDKQIRNT